MNDLLTQKIKSAPKTPGVYIFYRNSTPLYVGKASNLKSRLQSYLKVTDIKNQMLHEEANKLKLIELKSPIEALIKEAYFIKTIKPQYNILWRDDKNYFYVAFTKDKFPKIFVTHQPKELETIGPFTDGKALRLVLRIIRRKYPYCTCIARRSSQSVGGSFHLRSCLNAQIGNCLDYCCREGAQSDKKYSKNIKVIKEILSGKKLNALNKIIKPIDLWALENVFEHSEFLDPSEINYKIECYDISHFAGKEAVGAFTVLVNKNGKWEPDKNQFRKFRIRSLETRNDPEMISEILSRRLNHPEWPYPNLIVIDGGITQYNSAKKISGNIPLISFAKPNKKIFGKTDISKEVIEKAINQTHNYVINFHRHVRGVKIYQ